jgi:hypothetical protein
MSALVSRAPSNDSRRVGAGVRCAEAEMHHVGAEIVDVDLDRPAAALDPRDAGLDRGDVGARFMHVLSSSSTPGGDVKEVGAHFARAGVG